MANDYLTIEQYINTYEPQYVDEVEIQAADLGPWLNDKEKQLDLSPVYDEAKQRVYQKSLVAWAFSR